TPLQYGPVNGAPMPLNALISPMRIVVWAAPRAAAPRMMTAASATRARRGLMTASCSSGRGARDDGGIETALDVPDVRVHRRPRRLAVTARDGVVDAQLRGGDPGGIRRCELGGPRRQ